MFKNLSIYRLIGSDFDLSTLSKFVAPLPQSEKSSGFVDPRDTGIFHRVGDFVLLMHRATKKLIPKSAVDEIFKEQSNSIFRETGFKPGRKAAKEMREEIILNLLPRALASISNTAVLIDLKNKWVVVDSSSENRAFEILREIAKSAHSFSAESISVKRIPSELMTEWLSSGDAPSGFTIDSDAVMQATGDSKSAVKYSNQIVSDIEMIRRTEEGKKCVSLAMTCRDKISFVLIDSLAIKKVKIIDVLKSDFSNAEGFDSEFTLMAMEFNLMISELVAALGGFSK